MGRHQFLAVAGATTDHDRADQAGDAGIDVHHGAAREVDGAPGEDQSGVGIDRVELGLQLRLVGVGRSSQRLGGFGDRVRAGPVPDHVRDREVDEGYPERDEQRHRGELHALRERADDQRRRDRRERHLEADVDDLGERDADREGGRRRLAGDAFEEQLVEAADDRRAAGEGEAVAVDHPDQHHDADRVEDMGEHRQRVLRTNKAGIEQREARDRHQQDEDGRRHHPGSVTLVEIGWRRGRRRAASSARPGTVSRNAAPVRASAASPARVSVFCIVVNSLIYDARV